jgi:hypothetical protein
MEGSPGVARMDEDMTRDDQGRDRSNGRSVDHRLTVVKHCDKSYREDVHAGEQETGSA